MDEKDKTILNLQKQFDKLKGVIANVEYDNANINESIAKRKILKVTFNKFYNN